MSIEKVWQIAKRRLGRILGLSVSLLILALIVYGCAQGPVQLGDEVEQAKTNIGAKGEAASATPTSHNTCPNVKALEGQDSDEALKIALADKHVQELKARLEAKGLRANLNAAKAYEFELDSDKGIQVVIPFEPKATISFAKYKDTSLTKAQIELYQAMIILEPDQPEYLVRIATEKEHKEVLEVLHKSHEYGKFKKELKDKGYTISEKDSEAAINEGTKETVIFLKAKKNDASSNAYGLARGQPQMPDEGSSTGAGGTDIIVIYDGWHFYFLSPTDGSFVYCWGGCMLRTGLSPTMRMAIAACILTCQTCGRAPTLSNLACIGCGLCGLGSVGLGAYCIYSCL